jgi:acetylglutamate kinase
MLNVIKIGGNILDDEEALSTFLTAFSQLDGEKILVHGGGKIATEIGHKLGIEPNYVNGRRVTDALRPFT